MGAKPSRFASSGGPRPTQHASGMPCTLPLGELSGVFISACASIQIRPICCFFRRKYARHAGHRPDRHGVVAAQHQRHLLLGKRAIHHARQALARQRDLRQVLGPLRPLRQALRAGPPECCPGRRRDSRAPTGACSVGHADRRGTHVHAAAALAEVERRTDDGNVRLPHEVVSMSLSQRTAVGWERWRGHCAELKSRAFLKHLFLSLEASPHVDSFVAARGVISPLGEGLVNLTFEPKGCGPCSSCMRVYSESESGWFKTISRKQVKLFHHSCQRGK